VNDENIVIKSKIFIKNNEHADDYLVSSFDEGARAQNHLPVFHATLKYATA